MGIGGLDSEFSTIFRRAFASRVFPPGLVEKLGIQHVKGARRSRIGVLLLLIINRYSTVRPSGNRKNSHGQTNWKDAERPGTQDC